MTKKTCKGCAIACLLISLLGLVSFLGGIKPVNIGAFVFPLLLAASVAVSYLIRRNGAAFLHRNDEHPVCIFCTPL